MRVAYFWKTGKTLTYFTSRNTTVTVNCVSLNRANRIILKSGIDQDLKTV